MSSDPGWQQRGPSLPYYTMLRVCAEPGFAWLRDYVKTIPAASSLTGAIGRTGFVLPPTAA